MLCITILHAQQPRLIIPIGHTDDILHIGFSMDSKNIVTTSRDSTVGVWETASGKMLFKITEPGSAFAIAKYSHNGKMLLTVVYKDTSVQSGFSLHQSQVVAIKIWDAITGHPGKVLAMEGNVEQIDFSKDDKQIIVQTTGRYLVYDIATMQLAGTIQEGSVAVSPNQQYLVTYSSTETDSSILKIRNVAAGNSFKPGAPFKTIMTAGDVQSISFSNDEKYILLVCLADLESHVTVYEAATGRLISSLPTFDEYSIPAVFSPRGNYILTVDGSVKIWHRASGALKDSLRSASKFTHASFSADEKYIVTEGDSAFVQIWDAATGNPARKLINENRNYAYVSTELKFSADGRYVITTNKDYQKARIWEAATGKLVYDADEDNVNTELRQQNEFVPVRINSSADGKYLAITKHNKARILNTRSNQFMPIQAVAKAPYRSSFSQDSKYVVTIYPDSTANIWEVSSGKMVYHIKEQRIRNVVLNGAGIIAVLCGGDSLIKAWNVTDGKFLYTLKFEAPCRSVSFNHDGKLLLSVEDRGIKTWQAETGKLINQINIPLTLNSQFAGLSPDGNFFITDRGVLWDVTTRRQLHNIPIDTFINSHGLHSTPRWDFFPNGNICFSPDGKYLAAVYSHYSYGGSMEGIGIVNISTGDLNYLIDESFQWNKKSYALNMKFSPDGKSISVLCSDGILKTWDILTRKNTRLDLHQSYIHASFSPDMKYIVTASTDYSSKILTVKGGFLYSFITVDSINYLVTDNKGRYDGSDEARKLLYYVCDNEIIELDQLKEIFWEPTLAAKLTGSSTQPIYAKSLEESEICGTTPLIEQLVLKDGRYHFTITPRKGGLSEVYLFVGGKRVKIYFPANLKKKKGSYELIVNPNEIKRYLVKGAENTISVKASTEDNQLFSKGENLPVAGTKDSLSGAPNLYCIAVGICDYKGDKLDLKYASQDAADFEQAISNSSRKLLNYDGKEHVTSYVFNTDPASPDRWPLKENIQKAFDTIAKKATANDILLVYLSGHGVLSGKQFYYLTQQASALELAGTEKEVSISSDELNLWMTSINAQKQVLILDACNSGQAVHNLVTRKDIPPDQQRALEKLKDITGTYLLSASASSQSAFEMGFYNRGLLTYSLLLGIKSKAGLEGDRIDISRWFQFAADKTKELARDVSNRQDPQVSLNGTFAIGIATDELSAQIKLVDKKPLFKRSNFQNSDQFIDDLNIAPAMDKALNELTFQGKNRPLVFFPEGTGDDFYSINGQYTIKENKIEVKAKLFKGTTSILSINIDVASGNISELVNDVVKQVIQKLDEL